MKTRIYLLTTALVAGTVAIAQAQSPSSQSQTTSPPAKQLDNSTGSSGGKATTGNTERSESERSPHSARSNTGKSDSDRSDTGKSTTANSSTSGTTNDQSRDQPRSSDNAQPPSRSHPSNDNARAPRDRANDNAQSRDRINNRDAERSGTNRDTRDAVDRDNRSGTSTSRSESDRPAANQQTDRGSNTDTDRMRTSTNVDVNINTQQRTRINQSIARLDVKPITNVNFSVSVGTVIPRNVQLHTLPSDVVEIVPQYRGYSFFMVRDEVVIVEPSSHKIVTVIQRGGGGRAEASPRQRTAFTEKDRAAVRKYSRSHEPRTTGSAIRERITVGERVPASVELQAFPEEVYVDAPELREYRYLRQENRTYVIEPQERTIIEEID